jgi:hypothetical protein
MRKRAAATFCLIVLSSMACAESRDTAKPEAQPKIPDSTSSSRQAGPTPTAVYRDSANVFDPDGYYTIADDLTIHGRQISWLDLHTVDYSYDGEIHYERPKLVDPPEVGIALSELNDPEHHSRYTCTAPLITPDTLWVRCPDTPVGRVTVNGHFLDKAGKYSINPAYDEKETLLLIARVVVSRDGTIIHDAVHRFLYRVGD